MISGPNVPTNDEGLLALLESEPEAVETGLELVALGLALGDGLVVDAVARDAVGKPVAVVLACDEERDNDLSVRMLSLHHWFGEHARFLTGRVPGVAFPADGTVRLMVIGTSLRAPVVASLNGLGIPLLQVLRVMAFELDGKSCFGVRDLSGSEGAHDSFDVPVAVSAAEMQDLGRRFLDLVRRLDSAIEVRGDRYGRRLYMQGQLLAALRVQPKGLAVSLPEDVSRPLADSTDVAAQFDRVARRYLDLVRATPRSHCRSRPRGGAAAAGACSNGAGVDRAGVEISISRDEFEALQYRTGTRSSPRWKP